MTANDNAIILYSIHLDRISVMIAGDEDFVGLLHRDFDPADQEGAGMYTYELMRELGLDARFRSDAAIRAQLAEGSDA